MGIFRLPGIRLSIVDAYRTYYIESGAELSHGVIVEVIVDTTGASVVSVVSLIHHSRKSVFCIFMLKLSVREFD